MTVVAATAHAHPRVRAESVIRTLGIGLADSKPSATVEWPERRDLASQAEGVGGGIGVRVAVASVDRAEAFGPGYRGLGAIGEAVVDVQLCRVRGVGPASGGKLCVLEREVRQLFIVQVDHDAFG